MMGDEELAREVWKGLRVALAVVGSLIGAGVATGVLLHLSGAAG